MQRPRHGQRSRHSHRSPSIRLLTGHRPRTVGLLAVAAAGLAIAVWLPARSDSASASENGRHSSSDQHGDRWHHDNGRRRYWPQFPGPSDSGFASPGESPTEVPTTVPTGEAPSSPAPTITAPTTEPTTAPPTTEPTTAPATTVPTTAPTTAPAAAEWAPFTDYAAGQVVSFHGVQYEVLSAHTALPEWEPPTLPALFKLIG